MPKNKFTFSGVETPAGQDARKANSRAYLIDENSAAIRNGSTHENLKLFLSGPYYTIQKILFQIYILFSTKKTQLLKFKVPRSGFKVE